MDAYLGGTMRSTSATLRFYVQGGEKLEELLKQRHEWGEVCLVLDDFVEGELVLRYRFFERVMFDRFRSDCSMFGLPYKFYVARGHEAPVEYVERAPSFPTIEKLQAS